MSTSFRASNARPGIQEAEPEASAQPPWMPAKAGMTDLNPSTSVWQTTSGTISTKTLAK